MKLTPRYLHPNEKMLMFEQVKGVRLVWARAYEERKFTKDENFFEICWRTFATYPYHDLPFTIKNLEKGGKGED